MELRKPVIPGDTILVQVHAGPAFTGDNSFIPQNHTAGLAAFDARTHKQLRFFRPPEGTPTGTTLYLQETPAGNQEIVAATSGTTLSYLGIDQKTGKLDWLIPVANKNSNNIKVITPPVVSNGILYIVNDSKLLAIPLNAK